MFIYRGRARGRIRGRLRGRVGKGHRQRSFERRGEGGGKVESIKS